MKVKIQTLEDFSLGYQIELWGLLLFFHVIDCFSREKGFLASQ